jgi:serine phosphatase RsbU (regulator of sigma subunit)
VAVRWQEERRPADSAAPGRRRIPHLASAAVLILVLAITGVLTATTLAGYHRSEHRLLSLQTQLTAADIVSIDPLAVDDYLGGATRVAAATDGNAAPFDKAMSKTLTTVPSGALDFAAVSLWQITASGPRLRASIGSRPLLAPSSGRAAALIRQAVKASPFLVTELTAPHIVRIGYAIAETGPDGTFVGYAEQPLPPDHRISVPANSPLAQLNLALYFGKRVTSAALIELYSAAPVPLRGTTYTATFNYGNAYLTLVTSPRTPIPGITAEVLPWVIAGGGLFLSLLAGLLTEYLIRRREQAEKLTDQVRQLYVEQRSVAETLQHALLPQRIPDIPGVRIAVRYLPAAGGADIGGDWYDVVPLGEDRFVFVVGDVSGHDVRAAAVMASMHYTSRAYALEGHAPEAILHRLRQVLDLRRDGHFATVLCGLVEVTAHKVTMASAGHLPPLVTDGTDATFAAVTPGTPIGMPERAAEPVTVTVPDRGVLIAYTDGLVERRGESLDAGRERLADMARQATDSLEELLDGVVTKLTGDEPQDDVALIGLKWLS